MSSKPLSEQPHLGEISDLDRLLEANRRLTDEVKRRIDQLAAINKVATAVGQSLDLDLTLQTALSTVLDVIPVEAAGISLIDEASQQLVLRAQLGWKRDFVEMGMRMPQGHGLAWYAIETDQLVVTGDVSQDDRIKYQAFQEEGIMAQALAPMHAHGRVIGVLSVLSYAPYDFAADELDVLAAVADQIAMAIENASLYRAAVNSRNHLNAILDSTAEAIIALGTEGKIQIVNDAAEALFEVKALSLLGQPVERAPFPDALTRAFREMLAHDEPTPLVFDGELGSPGRFQVLSYAVSPVLDEMEQVRGCVAVIRDITHIREIETLKSQAIQTASHDIRTPLSGVRNALDLLMKVSPDLSEQQATLIEMAMVSVERVQTMAKGLLNIEQIESGIALNEAVNLSEVLRRAVDEAGGVAGGREVTLEIEVSDSLAPVAGSSIWLERAVANYLSNAVRYAPRGSAVLTRLFTEGGEVRLEVSDTGPGIPVEMQDRVFERFFRGAEPPDNDLPPGSGLGLAIVKRVVEAHNGRVYVRSRSGDGATFGFGIPEARYE